MKVLPMNRRELLTFLGIGSAAFCFPTSSHCLYAADQENHRPFRLALNTGTLIGFNLSIEEEIDIAAKAGYDGIEIWMMRLEKYLAEGKKLTDLRKRIEDHGLALENIIGFAPWIVDDDEQREKGVAQMQREMELMAELGGTRIAAPASGATGERIADLEACGERYRRILEIGDSIGVTPLLELWGGSKTLCRLSDTIAISVAAAHPKASLLLDAYHLYKGDNDFESLRQINGASMHVFHLNDYPAAPPRETIADKDRVFPGDGICPLEKVIAILYETGFRGTMSLELFNPVYWENQTPAEVAATGLAKMKDVIDRVKI